MVQHRNSADQYGRLSTRDLSMRDLNDKLVCSNGQGIMS